MIVLPVRGFRANPQATTRIMAIEFSRNITFGQYIDIGSPVHRLDPRTKIIAAGLILLALLATRTFSGLGVGFLGALLLQFAARIPLGYTVRGMRLLLITVLIFAIFQILFFPNPSVGVIWQWGILSLSWSGFELALQTFLRVILLYHLTSTLLFTTPLMDLADGIEVLLDPLKYLRVPVHELVLTFVIALKFVPILVGELERMVKAQAARGASLDRGNLLERARRLGSLLVPLFVNAFLRAEVLTTAMNARCYRGGQGRTKRRVLHMRRSDYVTFAVTLVLISAVFLAARI
ncbi:MAG: energy-coupling factor transporter transmembrane protein EcfT [Oscillochloris sp.]|nr:energy-coupling factor transporter transmembrane protein EcfT [Oscillochloris sp.]